MLEFLLYQTPVRVTDLRPRLGRGNSKEEGRLPQEFRAGRGPWSLGSAAVPVEDAVLG